MQAFLATNGPELRVDRVIMRSAAPMRRLRCVCGLAPLVSAQRVACRKREVREPLPKR